MNKQNKNTKSFIKKGVFPHKWAFTLLIPLRNIFLSPRKLLNRLQLKKHDSVLEIGPGPGYFSPKVAKEIPHGKLVLADIQEEMLALAKKRMAKYAFKNIEYHLCNGESFPFEKNSFNVIFLVTVLGEVENKEYYVQEFFRILCPGGIVSVSELWGDPDKISQEELMTLFEKKGFVLDTKYGSSANFTMNFKKP